MTQALQELLHQIQQLPSEDRLILRERLARLADPKLMPEGKGTQPSQAELLADLRRRSYQPPCGTPDSVELLRQDRER